MVRYPYSQPVDKAPFRANQPSRALYGLTLLAQICVELLH